MRMPNLGTYKRVLGLVLSAGLGASVWAQSVASPKIGNCQIFPNNAIFNTRIDDPRRFPVEPRDAAWHAAIDPSGRRPLHLDWGRNENPHLVDTYWGIPYNVVDPSVGQTQWPAVTYGSGVPSESDCLVLDGRLHRQAQQGCGAPAVARLPMPEPAHAKVEGGLCPPGEHCNDGDHHVLIVEEGACRLWEVYYAGNASPLSVLDGSWSIFSSAMWELNSLRMRPVGWTSGDAAGLPILPMLVRADEARSGLIAHALRVTLERRHMGGHYVWPARHQAGAEGPIPFGALLRLKSTFIIPTSWTPQAQAVARAMQRYGMYVADNGSELYVQGEPSQTWPQQMWDELQSIRLNQLEFVSLRAITGAPGFDPDSMAAGARQR